MVVSPTAVTFLVLSLLAMGWLAIREHVTRLDGSLAFHIGTYQRDYRKARFYFLSVWSGLLAAFASLVCLGMIATSVMNMSQGRQLMLGAAYGVGLWGVLVIALVWSQVGKRIGEVNSDGQSLKTVKEDKKRE